MFRKLLLAAVLALASAPALAQNPTCPTRPAGDNTNACASTAFVTTAVATAVTSVSITCPAHQFVNVISGSGSTCAQPAFTDISGQATLAQLPSIANDTVLGNFSGTNPTTPVAGAVPSCSSANQALTYNTSTHAFGCNSITTATNVQTVSYQITTSDCSKTVEVGTGSTGFLTLTLPAVAGFSEGCLVQFKNGDTGAGKLLSGFPTNFFAILWPLQSGAVQVINGAWTSVALPKRWKIATGTTNLFTDFSAGSDSNDCLAAGAGRACKTIQHALDLACDQIDFSSAGQGAPGAQAILTVNVLAGSTDTQGVHYSCHSLVGAQGGAALLLQGNGGAATINPTGIDALAFFLGVQLQIKNLTLAATTSGACLTAGYHARIDVLTGVTFGSCPTAQIACSDHADILLTSSYTVTAGSAAHWLASGPCKIAVTGGITITGGVFNYSTAFAVGGNAGQINYSGAVTLSGFNAGTSTKFNMATLSQLNTGGATASLPGSTAGTTNCTTGASSIGICGMAN